jgi:hypothetical protein
MKYAVLFLSFLFFSSSAVWSDDSKEKSYGKALALEDTIAVSKLLSNPESFVGKTVQVEGRIVGVCKNRGCWISIAGQNDYESIRIKVNDGEIVFPAESLGKLAKAEGIFEKLEPTGTCPKNCPHKGQKNLKAHKAENIKKVVQIKGQGAVIYQ